MSRQDFAPQQLPKCRFWQQQTLSDNEDEIELEEEEGLYMSGSSTNLGAYGWIPGYPPTYNQATTPSHLSWQAEYQPCYPQAQGFVPNGAEFVQAATASQGLWPRERMGERWNIVWCYERSHKPDKGDIRQQMLGIAHQFGASLICCKKAVKFEAWLERSTREYALIADWREAKPCLDMMRAVKKRSSPLLFVTICEQQRQYENALHWANNRPEDEHPVFVLRDVDSPPGALHHLLARARRSQLIRQSTKVPDDMIMAQQVQQVQQAVMCHDHTGWKL